MGSIGYAVDGIPAVRRYPGLAHAVRDLVGSGTVGFETDTLGASRLLDLRDQGVALADSGTVLRDWREEKASYDAPYFVLGAPASLDAIEGARNRTPSGSSPM